MLQILVLSLNSARFNFNRMCCRPHRLTATILIPSIKLLWSLIQYLGLKNNLQTDKACREKLVPVMYVSSTKSAPVMYVSSTN